MSTRNDTDLYAIQQNNVGVNCYMNIRNIDAAMQHFRQALAAKLAAENRLLGSSETSGDETRNFFHLQDMGQPLFEADILQQRCVTPEPPDVNSHDGLKMNASAVPEFVPYLYLTPFAINGQCAGESPYSLYPESSHDVTSATTPEDTTLASPHSTILSLMIIFNLALAHHTKDRASKKAYSIYQLAITLLSTLPPPTNSQSLLLHVAVLNNFGVWCFENFEYSSMMMSFDEMMYMLDETYACDNNVTPTLDVSVKRGIFHNLRAMLNDCLSEHS